LVRDTIYNNGLSGIEMDMKVEYFFIVVISLWLIGLTLVLIWVYRYFKALSDKVRKGNLIRILEEVLDVEKKNTKAVSLLKKEIKRIDEEKEHHFQKAGLVRFNPFKELGGDHSFVISMLNENNSGFLITGLHTRERTRVYMKEVVRGKCRLELSSEEKKALTKAVGK
jgi:hypothetical protein